MSAALKDQRVQQLMTQHKEALARLVADMEHAAGTLQAKVDAEIASRPYTRPARAKVTPPPRINHVPREAAIHRGKR